MVFHTITICQLLALFHFCSGRGKASEHCHLAQDFRKYLSLKSWSKFCPQWRATKVSGFLTTSGIFALNGMSNSWCSSKTRLGLCRNQALKTTVSYRSLWWEFLDKRPKQLVMSSLSSKQSMLLSMPEDSLHSRDFVVQNVPLSIMQLAWITIFEEKKPWKGVTQAFLVM